MMVAVSVAAGLLVIYVLLTAPSLKKRKCFFDKRFFAHRGLHGGNVCENTLAAFEQAADKGFGIELDVRLTKEGQPVIFHDGDLKRLCGREEKISTLTLARLEEIDLPGGQKIPTFQQALHVIRGRVPLLVEIKSHKMGDCTPAKKAWEALQDYPGPYMVQSFDPFQMRWFKKHAPQVIRGQLVQKCRDEKPFSPAHLAKVLAGNLLFNRLSSPHFVAYRYEDRKAFCYRMMRRVYRLHTAVWTVRSQAEADEMKQKANAIIFEGFQPE